jgi:hypothetical protein
VHYLQGAEAEAPDLMAHDEESGHCYFRRQPSTPEETERACRAVWVSCCGAVQYRGDDLKILEAGAIRYFDCAPLSEQVRQIVRSRQWRFSGPANAALVHWSLGDVP